MCQERGEETTHSMLHKSGGKSWEINHWSGKQSDPVRSCPQLIGEGGVEPSEESQRTETVDLGQTV